MQRFPKQQFTYQVRAEGTARFETEAQTVTATVRVMPKGRAKWRIRSEAAVQALTPWSETFDGPNAIDWQRSQNVVVYDGKVRLDVDQGTGKFFESGVVYLLPRTLQVPVQSVKLVDAQYAAPAAGIGKADIVWVIDVSAPMSDAIENIRSNAEQFVDALAQYNIDWRMGIVLYDETARLHPSYPDWITDAAAFKAAFAAIEPSGSEIQHMTGAIHAAHADLFPMRPDAARIIIVLSGSEDNTEQGNVTEQDQQAEVAHLVSEGITVYVVNTFAGASNHDIYWTETGGDKLLLTAPDFGLALAAIGDSIAIKESKITFEVSGDGDTWTPLESGPVVFPEPVSAVWVRIPFEAPGGEVTPELVSLSLELEHVAEQFAGIHEGEAVVLWEDGTKQLTAPAWQLAPPVSLLTGQPYPDPRAPEVTYTLENLSDDPNVIIQFSNGQMSAPGGDVLVTMSYPVMEEHIVSSGVQPGIPVELPVPEHPYGSAVYVITDVDGPAGTRAYFTNGYGPEAQRTENPASSLVLYVDGGGGYEPWASDWIAFDGTVNGPAGFAPYRFVLPANTPPLPAPGSMVGGRKLLSLQSVRYVVQLVQLTSEDGADTSSQFRIYFTDTKAATSRTFPDADSASTAVKEIEAVCFYQMLLPGEQPDELPEEWPEEDFFTDVFESGIGDLDDLMVSLGDVRPETVAFEVVGRRFAASEPTLSYLPVQVTVSLWATGQLPWNNYQQAFEYEVLAYPQKRFTLTVHGTATLDNGDVFTGSRTWTGVTVDASSSPKPITGPILQELTLKNQQGATIDAFLNDHEAVFSFAVEVDDPEVTVRFSDTQTASTAATDAFVEAVYTEVYTSGRKSGSITHPGVLQVPNPLQLSGDVRYRLVVYGSAEVEGCFTAPDGTPVSQTTGSSAGAWTTDPSHHVRIFLASPMESLIPWESAKRTFAYQVNERGDYKPVQVIASITPLGIPAGALNLQLHLRVERGITNDGMLVTESCGAHFTATQTATSPLYTNLAALESSPPALEIWSTHMGERQVQALEEVVLHEGTASIDQSLDTPVAQLPLPDGVWHSFIARTAQPGYAFRAVIEDGHLVVYGRRTLSSGRWVPQVNRGTYYHGAVEYAKMAQPAVFTVRGDASRPYVTTGTVTISGELDGERLNLARFAVQAPSSDVWTRVFKRPLSDVLQTLGGGSYRNLSVQAYGNIEARLNGGYLEVRAVISATEGTFKQTPHGAVFPVQLPLRGPVIVYDTHAPERFLTRLDDWAEAGFEREIELAGKGYPLLVMPIPHAKLLACYEGTEDITGEVDLIGAALIRYGKPFTFGQAYRVRLRAVNSFGVLGEGADLRLAFSDNNPSLTVVAEQDGSPKATEPHTIPVPWTDPATGEVRVEPWRPETEQVTLSPFENPFDRGFIVVSNRKRRPYHLRCHAAAKSIPDPTLPVHVICSVTDAKANPVGGEVVRIDASWSQQPFYGRTDLYGHVAFSLPGPGTPGVHSITAACRGLTDREEVIIGI